MSCFEITEDDLDLILIKYVEYHLNELTFYGSSKTEQMLMLIKLDQELNLMEKNIIDNNYMKYVEFVKIDINNPNIYYLQKIFFTSMNLIIRMIMLLKSNKLEIIEFEYKSMYLIEVIENFVKKIISPIDSYLTCILNLNKIFKLENSIRYLKNFVKLNKNKFTSNDSIFKLNKLFNEFDDV